MKRLLAISLIVIFTLTGYILWFFIPTTSRVYIVVDKTSGVNYYWVVSGTSGSLTPVYNKDGNLVIDKVE